jgi:hypothetical protein
MKKRSLILILLMVLSSTSLVASAVTVDPFYLLNQLDDGCYNVNATGYYEISSCAANIPPVIPSSMNVTVNSTVRKSGTIVTLTSLTSNPSVPVSFPTVTVDFTDLQFADNITTWVANGEIGFSANIIYNRKTIPTTGVAKYEKYENGLFIFSFKSLTLDTTEFISNSIKLDDEDVSGQIKVSVTKFDCGDDAEIPEFPTIALPVAAIIGLAFFMQRRKE